MHLFTVNMPLQLPGLKQEQWLTVTEHFNRAPRFNVIALTLHCTSTHLPLQDQEPPLLPRSTSVAFPGQAGNSPGDFDSLHLHQEEEAE